MPRAERLLELADLLRGRAETSVGALASELGVSRRTLLRDLASLRAQGLPITGEPGRGGGVRLEGERGLLAVHLSISEAVGLWLAARLSVGPSGLPWGRTATQALAKLLASLPGPKARALRALCRRVVVGPEASVNQRAGAGAAPPELLRLFEEAFSAGQGLAFQYRDREGRGSARRVEPHGLLVVSPIWYIIARDLDTGAGRLFRMDRITRPTVLAAVAFQPDLRFIQTQFTQLDRWQPLIGQWL